MRLLAATISLLLPSVASSIPSLENGAATPVDWSASKSAAVAWVQSGFTGLGLGPAVVEVNAATDGSGAGEWRIRETLDGPLDDGANVARFSIADLEGRHLVRVRVEGAEGSPLTLGELRLDRTGPTVSNVVVTGDPAEARTTVTFRLDDDGLSGVQADAPVNVEYETSTGWVAAQTQPEPGAGNKLAVIATGPLSEGSYPVRVTARDVVGNIATRSAGTVFVDRRAPVVSDVRITSQPTDRDATVELAYTVSDPQPGSGIAGGAAIQLIVVETRAKIGDAMAGPGEQRISGVLPREGTYQLVVTAGDVSGNIGTSAPVSVVVPAPPPPAVMPPGPVLSPITQLRLSAAGIPSIGPRWALSAARRLHSTRGTTVTARLATARTPAAWAALLGTPDAARFDGYASFDGVVAIGPAATLALEKLREQHRCIARCKRMSRADQDRAVSALAVVLHESLHASGPAATSDYVETASGRAFEESFSEAATVDLLPEFVAILKLSPRVQKMIRPAVRRYRPHYPDQLTWAQDLSTAVTTNPAAARRWRLEVADTWGADRWTRLAAATGRSEADLRASAPALVELPTR